MTPGFKPFTVLKPLLIVYRQFCYKSSWGFWLLFCYLHTFWLNSVKSNFPEKKKNHKNHKTLLEIRKSQDLAKDLGGTASKAEKKICQSKIVSYIQKHNKTVIPKMETKWKEKEKKRRKEKKRSEEKKVLPRCELRPFVAPGESFTTRPRGTHTPLHGIFII